MQITLSTGIKCPNCNEELEIETGFWGALFFGSVVASIADRAKKEGVTVTCHHCGTVSEIDPE